MNGENQGKPKRNRGEQKRIWEESGAAEGEPEVAPGEPGPGSACARARPRRITEWVRLEGSTVSHLVPAQAGLS